MPLWLQYPCQLDRGWLIQNFHLVMLRLSMMVYIREIVNMMAVLATQMELYLYHLILFNIFLNFVNSMVLTLNLTETVSKFMIMVETKQS